MDPKIRLLRTLIFLNYFLCWLFVLIISLPEVHWLDVIYTLWVTVFTEIEPFSG